MPDLRIGLAPDGTARFRIEQWGMDIPRADLPHWLDVHRGMLANAANDKAREVHTQRVEAIEKAMRRAEMPIPAILVGAKGKRR